MEAKKEKNIVLGITGGIAAYKMVELASRLTKAGHNVFPIMTDSAQKFVGPVTFRSITHNSVESDLFTPPAHHDVKHISLADRADLFIVGPATANFIGKLANGIADDLLSTVIMATKAPVLLAPSMNVHMLNNPIVQDNMDYLTEKGYHLITPGAGYLACGYEGQGRLPEPVELLEHINYHLTDKDLVGLKILISAGPTREKIDPVRFITNYSSGKMGFALAREAVNRGADVTLVSGPVNLDKPLGVNLIKVDSALEMADTIFNISSAQDIIIMAAAVADYRPSQYSKQKIKKSISEMKALELTATTDILAQLGKQKEKDQLLVGFAAESENLMKNAEAKLKNKNLDYIVANDITSSETGFMSDLNQVTIISKDEKLEFEKMSKQATARQIFNCIIKS